MKDKEKQIRLLTKRISKIQDNGVKDVPNFTSMFIDNQELAEELLKYYQPKIPKDSVVITKEEQEQMNNELQGKIYQACKLEKQKTAEKIINYFVKEFPILKTRVIAKELAKQFGVEIQE